MKASFNLRKLACLLIISMSIVGCFWLSSSSAKEPETVGFNRHIRSILSDNCSACHGPDKGQRKGDLRLDVKEGLFGDRGDYRIVDPGKANSSELFRRISSDDPEQRMPPPDSDHSLTAEQIELIRRWIQQGAEFEQHWAFIAPRRPALPKTSNPAWCQSPIDYFVLAGLDRVGLKPTQPADRVTLLRRVTLDLTGLPPTPDEVDSFLADQSPDAYERVVDRLLQSPRFGECMAIRWLDLARYADTSGYQNDGPRYMWRWRDWVIDAYNAGMPFDQFTIEQLAGDLLANTPDLGLRGEIVLHNQEQLNRLIATAFNRNHRGNAEGGIIAEEYQVEYVVDRVETTATAWLGLTIGCARCHDHKYDPFTQKEFYSLFAYFNNVPEYGRAIKEGNSPPFIKAPTVQQRKRIDSLAKSEAMLVAELESVNQKRDAAQNKWEASFGKSKQINWTIDDGLIARYRLDGDLKNQIGDRNGGQEPNGGKIENGKPIFDEGKTGKAADFDGKRFVDCGDVGKFTYFDKFSITAWIYPRDDGTIVSRMVMEEQGDGYYIDLVDGKLQVNLVKRWLDDSIRVESDIRLAREQWQHIAVVYDGSRTASGITLYVNGQPQRLRPLHDFLNQTFTADAPLRIGAGNSTFQGRIDDVRIYDRPLSPMDVAIISTVDTINDIVVIPPSKRTVGQQKKINEYYLRHHAPDKVQRFYQSIRKLKREKNQLNESLPTLMVMHEMKTPRKTHLLVRGQYDKRGQAVATGVPKVLNPLPEKRLNNRLGLARWLVDPANPLTARVAVNRYWQMFFGNGLVSTMEDFGVQGARPTHPDLLDWLAIEFVRCGWDIKAMHKTIVMSATYRQSSRASAAKLQRDPTNALLARGPRLRLPAELIRDQALAASGLLTERLGGPSVKIYQPEGLWKEIATDTTYDLAVGDDLYRRSLYAYWKRTVSPPSMATFDAPSREACIVRRALTNTPLQALLLLNDPTYLEASRALAERIMKDGTNPKQRIRLAVRLVICREPTPAEITILRKGLESYHAHYQENPASAKTLIEVGHSEYDRSLDQSELAAYMTVASLILNLDEAITKE